MTTSIFCGNCGSSIPRDSVFCTNCGAQVPRQSNTQEVPHSGSKVEPPLSPTRPSSRPKSRSGLLVAIFAVVTTLAAVFAWNQLSQSDPLAVAPPTTVVPTTSSTTTSASTTTTTTTTTTSPPAPSGVAPIEFWISDVPMALPDCDSSYITIIASTNGEQAARSTLDYQDASYLRTDITCESLNPFFSSGSLRGQPIYLVFFGPYYSRFQAQQKCIDLGFRQKANCYVAPLTRDAGDRSERYGPLDP